MNTYSRPTKGPQSTGNQSDIASRGPVGPNSEIQDELLGAGDASAEAGLIKSKLTASAAEPPPKFIDQANRILLAASPDAKRILWEDPSFWALPFFKDNPRAADQLLRKLDPIGTLHLTLWRGRGVGWTADEALGEIQTWAQANGASCERALTDGALLSAFREVLSGDKLPKAIELLIHQGQVPDDALARLRRALDEKSEETFVSAWDDATKDAATLKDLASDAAFLNDVEATFSATVFAIVKRTLLANASALSEDDAGKLEGVVADAVKGLDELLDYWVDDATVMDALQQMNDRVAKVFPGGSPTELEGRQHFVRRQVIARMEAYIRGEYPDSDLGKRLERGLSTSNLTKARDLLAVPDVPVSTGDGKSAQEAWEAQADPLARQHAGAFQTEFDDWIVDDVNVQKLFAAAEQDFQKLALRHVNDLPTALGLTRRGLSMVQRAYDQQYGSLVDALQRGVQTQAIREHCLNLIQAKDDGTTKILDKAAGGVVAGKDTDEKQDQMRALSGLHERVRTLAEHLDQACESKSASKAKEVAGQVNAVIQGLPAGTTTVIGAPMVPAAEIRAMFSQAFATYGGSLEHRIVESFPDTKIAQEIFDKLGIGANAARVAAGEGAAGLTDEQVDDQGDYRDSCIEVFAGLERASRTGEYADILRRVKALLTARDAYNAAFGTAAKDLYKETNGIDLIRHLGLKVKYKPVRDELEGVLGQPIPATLKTTKEEAEKARVGVSFDQFAVSSTFTLDEARKRAMSIQEDIDNNKNTIFQLSQNGNKEELRVVVAVFEDLYGYNPLFAIKEAQSQNRLNSKEVDAAAERLRDAGQASFGQRLIEMAKMKDIDAVYEVSYKAKPEDKKSFLADGKRLAELRRLLDERQWERVWESLNGTLSMGEALRTREGWMWGWGSDDEGMKKDVTMIGEKEKADQTATVGAKYKDETESLTGKSKQKDLPPSELASIRAELKALGKKKADEVDEAFKAKMRGLWADLEVRAILQHELSGEALLTLQQLILGGGTQTGTEKAWAEAESWGNASNIIGFLKEMSDEERAAKRKDPRFLAMLTGQLRGAELSEALAIVHAKKGEENATGIEKALNSAGVDEQAIFASIGAMSTAELIALARDEKQVMRIRAKLRDDDLKRFDASLVEIRTLGDQDLAPGNNADGEQASDWTEAARKQERQRLVFKHSLAIQEGVTRGKDELLAALQAVYTEKGEITPKKDEPETKDELFTAEARQQVENAAGGAVSEYYGVGSQLHSLTVQAIHGKADPAEARLKYALGAYWDNMDNAKEALAGVSEKELVEGWSNVVKNGEDGRSLKAQYDAYKAERDAQHGKTPTPDDAHKLEALRYRYVDFPLDVSEDLVDVLARRSSDAWVGEYMTTRALLEMKQIVRAKIVALPSMEIAKAIGVAGAADLEALKGKDPAAAEKVQAEVDTANGTDRQARSMHSHLKELGAHEMTADSLADGFTYTDEQMATYYSHYAGAYGEATEKKAGESGSFGTIDETEKAEMDARAARFKVSVEEYKAAKSKVAEVMKWIAIAVIGAVSAAFTGPAGPTLLVALLTAGATATVSVAIDEAVQGNDYDAGTEGVQKIVTDVGTAALTFGLSKGWDMAAKNYKLPGAIDSAIEAVTKKEKEIAEAMKAAGFGPHAMWNFGKAALQVPLDEISGAAVSALDLSELKYGWAQGATHADKTFRGALDGMDAKMRDALIKALIDTGFERLKDKLFPEEEKKKGVPGTEKENPVPTARTDEKVVTDAFGKTLSWGKLKEAAFDQTAEVATGHLVTLSNGKTVNLSSADGISFLETYVKGRIGGFVKQLGTEIGTERSNRIIMAKASELSTHGDFQALSADEQLSALKLYVHVLKDDSNFPGYTSLSEFAVSPSAFMAGKWKEVDVAIKKAVPTGGLTSSDAGTEAEFRAWVLAEPDKIDERLSLDYTVFAERLGQAKAKAEEMKDPKLLAKLATDEERSFFQLYVSDPKRLMDFSKGEVDDSLDLTTADGLKAFKDAVLVSKLAIGGNLLPKVKGTEAQKQEFGEWFKKTGYLQVTLDPSDEAYNERALQDLFDARAAGATATDPAIKAFQQSVLNPARVI